MELPVIHSTTMGAWPVHQHRVFLQGLSGSGGSVWTAIPENTQCGRHCSDPSTECSKRISWDSWRHRLHALEMEELPICLAGDVQSAKGGCSVVLEAVAT